MVVCTLQFPLPSPLTGNHYFVLYICESVSFFVIFTILWEFLEMFWQIPLLVYLKNLPANVERETQIKENLPLEYIKNCKSQNFKGAFMSHGCFWLIWLFIWIPDTPLAAKSLQSCPTLCDPIDSNPPGSPVPLAAAAAKSLQSCPTLYDPIDGSPPGSPVPGILQAKTLEWVAISFSTPVPLRDPLIAKHLGQWNHNSCSPR